MNTVGDTQYTINTKKRVPSCQGTKVKTEDSIELLRGKALALGTLQQISPFVTDSEKILTCSPILRFRIIACVTTNLILP